MWILDYKVIFPLIHPVLTFKKSSSFMLTQDDRINDLKPKTDAIHDLLTCETQADKCGSEFVPVCLRFGSPGSGFNVMTNRTWTGSLHSSTWRSGFHWNMDALVWVKCFPEFNFIIIFSLSHLNRFYLLYEILITFIPGGSGPVKTEKHPVIGETSQGDEAVLSAACLWLL